MQKLISQLPELSTFLANIPKNEHPHTVKQLIRLGLQTIHSQGKENQKNPQVLIAEIDRIKSNLQELNHMVKHQCHHHCGCYYEPPNERPIPNEREFPTRDVRQPFGGDNYSKSFSFQPPRENNCYTEPPVREARPAFPTSTIQNEVYYNPFAKNKKPLSRHHLDDTEAKEAIRFPPSILVDRPNPPTRRKSQQYKKHIYQEEINKEEIVKLKEEREDSQEHYRRDRTNTDYAFASSKIKSLIDKDRLRYYQRTKEEEFKEGFNKYEYSDENEMEEQSSIHDDPPKATNSREYQEQNTYGQQLQSSFRGSNQTSSQKSNRPSSKKEFQRSKKEVSSKLQASQQGGQIKFKTHSKHSSSGNRGNKTSERASDKYYQPPAEEQDDVISNSSSFSQFSINGSRKRDVGKISRRSNND